MDNDKDTSAVRVRGSLFLIGKPAIRLVVLLSLLFCCEAFSGGWNSHRYLSLYGSFHNNHFYIGFGNSFTVLPNVSGPLHLTALLIRQALKSMIMSGGIFRKSFNQNPYLKFTREKMVDCSSHEVAIDDPFLSKLLSIQTGCVNGEEPVWVIYSSPVKPFTIPNFDAKKLAEIPLFRLHQLMNEYQLSFIALQPFRIWNSVTNVSDSWINIYTCNVYQECHAIEFEHSIGADYKWLIEELLVRTHSEPWPLLWQKNTLFKVASVFDQMIIEQLEDSLNCLLQNFDLGGQLNNLRCEKEQQLLRQNEFKWRFFPINSGLQHQDWLFTGAGYRILPLQPCKAANNNRQWMCPSYLVWSQNSARYSEFSEKMPVLSIRFDDQVKDYQARYFNNDFRGIGYFDQNENHAEKLLRYLIGLPVGLGLFSNHYSMQANDQLLPVSDIKQLYPLINRITKLFFLPETVNSVRQEKIDMQLSNKPLAKQSGANSAGFWAPVSVGQGGMQRDGWGNAGRRNSQASGGRGNGRDGFGPPFSGGARPYVMPGIHDFNDMLRQLFRQGFLDNYLPLTASVSAAITESFDLNGIDVQSYRAKISTDYAYSAAALSPRLTQPVEEVFHQIMADRFDPLNVNHMIALSEWMKQDVLIFLASAPGLHGYKYYRKGGREVISGELAGLLPELNQQTLVLAYTPRPLGFKRMGLPEKITKPILPVGVSELLHAYRHFSGASTTTDTDVKVLINNVLREYYTAATSEVLDRSRQYLARAGLLSVLPITTDNPERVYYSKTLLENIEWFWQNNRKHLLRDPVIFFNFLEDLNIERELKVSSSLRFDPSVGQVGGSEFITPYFIDLALPAMRPLVETQHQIVWLLKTILEKKEFISDQGWHGAVYGGAATRSHLLQHRFSGDLDQAVKLGALAVNDIDIMVTSEQVRDMLVTFLKVTLKKEFPGLNLKEFVMQKDHLHTYILKICFDWARIFSIDISYSDEPDYYDFTDVTSMELPAYQGSRGIIQLPVIGLRALIKRMVYESHLLGEKEETVRRRKTTLWNLQLFSDGDGIVKAILDELQPAVLLVREVMVDEPAMQEPQSEITEPGPELSVTEMSSFSGVVNSEPDFSDERPESPKSEIRIEKVSEETLKKKNDKGRRERIRRRKKQAMVLKQGLNAAEIELTERPELQEKEPEGELPVTPKPILIRTEESLEIEEYSRSDITKQFHFISLEPEPDYFSLDSEEQALISAQELGEGSVWLESREKKNTHSSDGSPVIFPDLFHIVPDDEAEIPVTPNSDTPVVPTRTLIEPYCEEYSEEVQETPQKSRGNVIYVLWEYSKLFNTDVDLFLDTSKPEPLLGWASFQETLLKENVSLENRLILQLRSLQAQVIRIGSKVCVLLDADRLKEIGSGSFAYTIPDLAFLEARIIPWNINDGRILLALYRARYFHQAFPYLVAIMGNPDSKLFQPLSLIKMAREFRKSAYPVTRRYDIVGNQLEWPVLDNALQQMTALLMAGDEQRTAMLKNYSKIFLKNMEQGQFHAGLGMVIHKLGGFSKTQQDYVMTHVQYAYSSHPGARWLVSAFQPALKTDDFSVSGDEIHLYRQWQLFREHHKNKRPDVAKLNIIVEQFRSILGYTPDVYNDYLAEQLMILDDELYMKFGWLTSNMKKFKRPDARPDDARPDDVQGYSVLGNMLLSGYFHLEKSIEYMMDVTRLRQMRMFSKARAELDGVFTFDDAADQALIERFMLRLHSAWEISKDDHYLKVLRELVQLKDQNAQEAISRFHTKLQQK